MFRDSSAFTLPSDERVLYGDVLYIMFMIMNRQAVRLSINIKRKKYFDYEKK